MVQRQNFRRLVIAILWLSCGYEALANRVADPRRIDGKGLDRSTAPKDLELSHEGKAFRNSLNEALSRLQRNLVNGFSSKTTSSIDGLVNTHLSILEGWDSGRPTVGAIEIDGPLSSRIREMLQELRKSEHEGKKGEPAVSWPPRASDIRDLMNARGSGKMKGDLTEAQLAKLSALLRLESERRMSGSAGAPESDEALLTAIAMGEAAGLIYEAANPEVDIPAALKEKLQKAYNDLPDAERVPEDRAQPEGKDGEKDAPKDAAKAAPLKLTAKRLAWLLKNKRDSLGLTKEELVDLTSSLMKQGYRERGEGYAMGAVRDAYRGLVARERERPGGMRTPPSLDELFPWLSGGNHPAPWNPREGLERGLADPGNHPGWREPDPENFFGNRAKGGRGGAFHGGGRGASVGGDFNGVLERGTPYTEKDFTREENACLENARAKRRAGGNQDWNWPFVVGFRSRPGAVAHCAGSWITNNAARAAVPSGVAGMCIALFLTAKHCVEPGDINLFSIRGISGITRIQVIPQSPGSSKNGRDDAAVVRAEMPCETAKNLPAQEVAKREELERAQRDSGRLAVALGLNHSINVDKDQSPTHGAMFGIAKLGGGSPNFLTFNMNDSRNASHPVRKGDSGSGMLACIRRNGVVKPVIAGALSFIFLDTPLPDGQLGGAASGGTLDWLHETFFEGRSTGTPPGFASMDSRPPGAQTTLVLREEHGGSRTTGLSPGGRPLAQ